METLTESMETCVRVLHERGVISAEKKMLLLGGVRNGDRNAYIAVSALLDSLSSKGDKRNED